MVPIYRKNKGDIQINTNYHGVKLMSPTMKLWEFIENKLRQEVGIQINMLELC